MAEQISTVLLWSGAVVALAGLYWLLIERMWLSPPLIATAAGIALGPVGLEVIEPRRWGIETMQLVEQVTWLTLAVSLAAIAVHLPPDYVRRHLGRLLIVAGVGTLLMWWASWAVVAIVVGGGTVGLLIAAAIAPTDPVLAGSIVTGPIARENIPGSLRHLLYAESGANDGLVIAAVMLPILLMTQAEGEAWRIWAGHTLLWQVVFSTLLGLAAGLALGMLQRFSQRRKLSDMRGMFPLIIALTFMVLGGLQLLEAGALLAVFVAAVAFHHLARDALEGEQEHIQDALQRFVQLPTFALLGAVLPWAAWQELGWRGAAVVGGILLLRRLPAWLLVVRPMVRDINQPRDALFMGWFGPIGLSAIYYAALAERQTDDPRIWPIVTLIVAASILLHGITATPLTLWMGRHRASLGSEHA